MNLIHWKRERQIAFLIAVAVCTCLGVFAGTRRVDPSADLYWLWIGLWGAAGAAMGAAGASISQLIRNRSSG
jgi:hypothetical protein